MTLALTLSLGVVIGLSLGALGGGGSILTVPALVFALGESAQAATTASLVIVGLTSGIAAISHARARHVEWRVALVFGTAGIAASYAGTILNHDVDQSVLLLAFAALMSIAAIAMLARTTHGNRPQPAAQPEPLPASVGSTTRETGRTHRLPNTTRGVPTQPHTDAPRSPTGWVKIIAAGLLVGFLTGFLGVGGGFIIVPALVMAIGFTMPTAVGTSLVIISINSAIALAARAGHETFDWIVIAPFTIAAIAGSLAGKRLSDAVPAAALTRAFALLLIAVAIYTTSQAL